MAVKLTNKAIEFLKDFYTEDGAEKAGERVIFIDVGLDKEDQLSPVKYQITFLSKNDLHSDIEYSIQDYPELCAQLVMEKEKEKYLVNVEIDFQYTTINESDIPTFVFRTS